VTSGTVEVVLKSLKQIEAEPEVMILEKGDYVCSRLMEEEFMSLRQHSINEVISECAVIKVTIRHENYNTKLLHISGKVLNTFYHNQSLFSKDLFHKRVFSKLSPDERFLF